MLGAAADTKICAAGEALVKMRYAPINPSDIFCLQGIYGGWHPPLPATPGLEGARTMPILVMDDMGLLTAG